jgi:hypothetical protein
MTPDWNSIMSRSSLFLLVASIVSVSFGSGCGSRGGPPLGTVTGTVTLDGEPVPGVSVTFIPEDRGSPSYGGTDENGVYRLFFNQNRLGAEVGTHNVIIENREPETDDSGKLIDDTPVVKIPKKYQQPGQLTADVGSGRNNIDFDLEPDTKQNQQSAGGTRTASK